MKNIFFAVALLFLLAATGCDKSESELTTQEFRVKIIDEVCSNAVLQIQDSVLYQYGTNGFVKNGVTYDHVFTTRFTCADMAQMQTYTADKTGMVVKIRLLKTENAEPNCTTCAAIVPNAPSVFHWVALSRNWSN